MKKFIWLAIAMLMLGGCAPKSSYFVILPDPYIQAQERQMAIQNLEYQRRQAEAQEALLFLHNRKQPAERK